MVETLQLDERRSTKRCGCCGTEKPLSAFPRHRRHSDGRASECKECIAKRSRRWYRQKQRQTNGLYSTYVAMKQRCHCDRHDSYPVYGGRGICVCDEWRNSFDAFYAWAMRSGYQPGLQLDRIDNEKGYSPDNCRFVTAYENARNKRKRETPLRNNTKLTVIQVKQIRQLLAQEGVTLRELGRRFSVTHGTIAAIKVRRIWKEID